MMETISIGCDVEFMATQKGEYILPGLPHTDESHINLSGFGCDEFGHCMEVRPKQSTNPSQLVLNTAKAMSHLPEEYVYQADNAPVIEKGDFFKLVRSQGGKSLSGCKNIYGGDILDDCPADIEARKAGKRLLFCGMHMHVSASEVINENVTIKGVTENKRFERNVQLPMTSLTALFDLHIFPAFKKDEDFSIGRYRRPGFYERKNHGGFEYRSLGVSAFTPKRLRLVAMAMKEIVEQRDFFLCSAITKSNLTTKNLNEILAELRDTKPAKTDLRKLWVPWA